MPPKAAAPICMAVLLAGCVTEQDPSKAGFLDSVVNQSTGVYEKRQADLEAERKDLQAENQAISSENTALSEEQARLERRVRLAKQAIASLEARIAAAQAELAAEDARRQQLAEVGQGLTVEKDNLARAETGGTESEVLAILRQIDKLERDANTILEL